MTAIENIKELDANDRLTASIYNSIAEFKAIRQDIHQHPELAFKELRTSALIADYMRSYGYQIDSGIAKTGIVATLQKGTSLKSIGIRADMDALPIHEETGLTYASQKAGVMHACGHDGHVTIALAAAKALAIDGRFDGTVRFIFQPAEEIGQGAQAMIKEDLFTRFPVDAVYALHNWPDLPVGKIAVVKGAAMASVDFFKVKIKGKGSHGAEPQNGIDPITIAAYLITSLQTIVSRNINPQEMGVVTVGSIQGGNAANVIPDEVELKLTLRAYSENVRKIMKERLTTLVNTVTKSFGAEALITSTAGFSAVINTADEVDFAIENAKKILGESEIIADFPARTASEDFAFMLQQKKGAFIFMGNGKSAALHNPAYDFNDELIIPAARYWAGLVEAYLNEEAQ